MKHFVIGLVATLAFSSAPAVYAASVVTYNSNPTGGFQYGAGNDYTPANATVLVNDNNELAVRFHQTGVSAPASTNGVYAFALGTSPISYDFSIGNVFSDGGFDTSNANILLTSLLTGQAVSYNPFFPGNDNFTTATGDVQNSARLNFGFLFGNNFDASQNNTYRIDLSAGGNTITSFAQIGEGAVAPVPEPATWAMMLLGFGVIGFALRRRRQSNGLLQLA
ncbi:PEPxxWA-CTERM sorting domain-containing protein [Novosphingobium sp. Gsoil 351]|uniref:PEPxxWA-CTERM sorting domain-containing protein n=1 Tax=Novosphingobium sp. Gsoil 351 TaxID=2675225 RepID=UPI0012B4FB4C|nr:PEPxxWA-CTERM sorting domain-containing protein [Novosphingobium sp. Gsoil 351]QGN56127.1 PEPxxWA-CTERM sorting domain-containing protein [Novosphingobium sp. Gsoil 351]